MNKKGLVILLLALFIFSCRKDHTNNPVITGTLTGHNITVTVDQTKTGNPVPPYFQGFSFETQVLATNPEFLNANNAVLIQMVKNLGAGVLRIGGGTSDEVYWTGKPRTSLTGSDSVTTSDIDRLANFAKVTGWPVLFGLNLGANDIPAAVNEAMYVHNKLNSNLYAFQFGNEPDVFNLGFRASSYNYANYQVEWENHLRSVQNMLPQDSFAGPDVAYNTDWYTSFAETEHSKVKFLDAHHYNNGPASIPSINYHTILDYSNGLPYYLKPIRDEAAKFNMPFRISECNSIWGGGKPGTSDVFAASLWALDLMWNIAINGGEGINFHDGVGLCYSPVQIQGNNTYAAAPVYYAMLAFKAGSSGGKFIPTTASGSTYCSAYTSLNPDNTYAITLINKDDKNDYSFTVQLSKTTSAIEVVRLKAPTITSATGITFAGSAVNTDGTFSPSVKEQYTVNQKSFLVTIPAGSAAVVTVK